MIFYLFYITFIRLHFLYRVFEIFPPCRIRFIHFNFQLVEKFDHVQISQLIEINFPFAENVNFPVVTLYNLLISRNRIQLNGRGKTGFILK